MGYVGNLAAQVLLLSPIAGPLGLALLHQLVDGLEQSLGSHIGARHRHPDGGPTLHLGADLFFRPPHPPLQAEQIHRQDQAQQSQQDDYRRVHLRSLLSFL